MNYYERLIRVDLGSSGSGIFKLLFQYWLEAIDERDLGTDRWR